MTEPVFELEIRKLPDGGYIVRDAQRFNDPNIFLDIRMACTTIGEALVYIQRKLEPAANLAKSAQASQVQDAYRRALRDWKD